MGFLFLFFYFADDQEISQPSYKEGAGVDMYFVVNCHLFLSSWEEDDLRGHCRDPLLILKWTDANFSLTVISGIKSV